MSTATNVPVKQPGGDTLLTINTPSPCVATRQTSMRPMTTDFPKTLLTFAASVFVTMFVLFKCINRNKKKAKPMKKVTSTFLRKRRERFNQLGKIDKHVTGDTQQCMQEAVASSYSSEPPAGRAEVLQVKHSMTDTADTGEKSHIGVRRKCSKNGITQAEDTSQAVTSPTYAVHGHHYDNVNQLKGIGEQQGRVEGELKACISCGTGTDTNNTVQAGVNTAPATGESKPAVRTGSCRSGGVKTLQQQYNHHLTGVLDRIATDVTNNSPHIDPINAVPQLVLNAKDQQHGGNTGTTPHGTVSLNPSDVTAFRESPVGGDSNHSSDRTIVNTAPDTCTLASSVSKTGSAGTPEILDAECPVLDWRGVGSLQSRSKRHCIKRKLPLKSTTSGSSGESGYESIAGECDRQLSTRSDRSLTTNTDDSLYIQVIR